MVARELTWFKSSHSDNRTNSDCVEVALTDRFTAVRDSKVPTSGHLSVHRSAWSAFLATLKAS
ncbi:DUF397 domain-containing protein [Amycolatopsis sp. NPDC059021]|uniref:DUF397 domain-containing protein n=1 Tax=Amycolatopsis sp. NPDC059021 TaxID=3346704 RepID=UPI003670A3C7